MSALNAALCRSGIILWLAVLLASRSTHSAPVYDQDTTQIAEYDGAAAGCYFNFQRYQEGDRIITSEPCLNCTCHNRMLMCYLKVCPFTKAIGQDCTIEKRPDQCCPVITCPEVPVQLLTSTTSPPSTSDSTEIGFHDNYGCVVDNKFYADGAQLSLDHHNPCELCYCIRNRTTCVMQECTLRVAGCKPVYQSGVCCPIKYNCEYDEELSTTVGPTPGLIMTTTLPPGVLPQCYHKGEVYEDGDLIYSTQPCQHCYCFGGEIACAVQNCGTPMQAHGKNCTALPPPEGECCPTTYECEEEQGGTTLPQDEEQLPEQLPHDVQMTESPIPIDQEQAKTEYPPQEESFPDADNAIPHREVEEEEGVQGTIEHVVPSTEKPEEESATPSIDTTAVPEMESTAAESEATSPHEHVTETSIAEEEVSEAVTVELPAKTAETEVPTIVQETENLGSEEPATRSPEISSTSESVGLQPEEETKTTKLIPEENTSTEENVIEKELSTLATAEEEKPTEPSVKNETQAEEVTRRPEDEMTTKEELPAQIPEEVTKVDKTTEEGQISVTEVPEISEISTEIEKVTSPAVETEQAGTIVPDSVTKSTKESEDKVHPKETTSSETLATETESPLQETTATVAIHETSSTERISTEKEEISHPTEAAVTEQTQSTEVSGPPAEAGPAEEQKPVAGEIEKEQVSEEPISEHAVTEKEHVTVGAKKEDAGLIESPEMSEGPITEEQYTEKSTSEIPLQGPTGIPIADRVPVHKAEDEYHVTEDYYATTRPEVIPGNLVTELPQKTPTTYAPPQDQETTVTSLEEIMKPIMEEGTEVPIKETAKPIMEESTEVPVQETAKPIPEEITEINLPSQKESSVTEITTSSIEIKTESTSAGSEATTETFATTVTHEEHVPKEEVEGTEKPSVSKETETEAPQKEVQLTEAPSSEELPTKGLTFEESGESSSEEISGESGEKKSQPKKEESSEEEAEKQPSVTAETETVPEIPTSISAEHSTVPSSETEQATGDEQVITTISSAEQSTHITQAEEDKTEAVPEEKEEPVTTKKPDKEHVAEESTVTSGIPGEEEKELQTEEPVSKEEQTTKTIKEIEKEHTTQAPSVEEEKSEQPEQYSTEITPEILTESHDLQETPKIEEKPEVTEGIKGVSTEGAEQQTETTVTQEESSEENVEVGQTEITSIEPTELSVTAAYPTEKAEEEDEEKISISVSTPEVQTEIGIESTKAPAVEKETEKVHTEPSISEEHLPMQPSIADRKEDQESIEQRPTEKEQEGEEQVTHKPSLKEEEVTETLEEQKPVISSETEKTQVPPLEEDITESVLPEEKPAEETGITEPAGEIVTQPAPEEQPETSSEQAEEVITKLPGQEEQTQRPATEEQPELHMRKETELPGTVTQESLVTPTSIVPEKSTVEGETVGLSESTEVTISESTTKSIVIHETSTELPGLVEEHTEQEGKIPVEKEITTEFVPTEAGQQETYENASTQVSITAEPPSQELGEIENIPVEVSTEEATVSETSKIPEEQPQKSKDKDTTVKIPVHEHSTIAPEKTTEIETSTEISPKETSEYSTEYSTSIPEEIPVEEGGTSEIAPRPSGIPGEGNCLIEGQSYSNNSAVPPANECQTSCRCVSSIIQCELVQCPAPPEHLSNCMPVRTTKDLCCPMYACDSTPTVELESDSHMIESHTLETEKGQETVPPMEITTEEAVTKLNETIKESTTIASEITTIELQTTEATASSVSQMEEEVGLTAIEEKQQTTLKSVEPIYEQPIEQSVEQQPEEYTISSIDIRGPQTSEESPSQVPEEEKEYTEAQTPLEETTKVSEEEEGLIKSTVSTEQPREEITEEQTPVSDEKQQVITSTHVPAEEESHGVEEEGTTLLHKEEEITVPTVTEEEKIYTSIQTEASISTEKEEEVTTIETGKEEGITVPTKEEKPIEEEGIEEQLTLKPIKETEKERPEEEGIQSISEETVSSTTEEYGTSIKPEEVAVMTEKQPAKPEISEDEKTTESTSIPEIQVTTEHKPEEESKHEEEKEQGIVTSTESEQVAQTEEPETQTKLSAIVPGELETQEPVAPAESTTLIHDHTITEEAQLEEHATVRPVETSTEERKEEAETEISTEHPAIVEEHATTPILPIETETSGNVTIEQEPEKVGGEIAAKPTEESIPEVSHEETTPESAVPTETITEKEVTEHVEEHTELSSTEHGDQFITKLPGEKPFETVSPEISTEQPTKTEIEGITEGEVMHGKGTEPGIINELETSEVSIEEHPEVTPEIESHTTELSTEEHTTAKEISMTSVSIEEETSEQPVTSIVEKTSEPSLGETETEHLPEKGTETPITEEQEHVTVSIEKETPEPEKHVEEQTVASSIPSEGETPQSSISVTETTLASITKEEEQVTEKATESVKPEIELSGTTEEHTITPEVEKEIEEEGQKPGTTEETGEEEPVTEADKKTTEEERATEQTVTHVSTTEKQIISEEEHTEQETITPSEVEGVKLQTPVHFETTILPKEEEQGEVTSKASLPEEYPVSEKSTTVVSLIPEEHPTVSVETGEKEGTREPEYQTTISTLEEEVSKPVSELVEVEKLPPRGESVTAETETESAVTKVSVEVSTVGQPEEVSVETEKPVVEQETESPKEQPGEATTKIIEEMVTEEKLPEETVSQIPETEEKSTEIPSVTGEEEETTSTHEEEHPPIVKMQPTEGLIPSEEEIHAPEEIQPSQPEEGEEIHPSITEESQSTEQASEVPTAVEPEEHPKTEQTSEIISPAEEYPTKISGTSTELPEEKITLGSIPSAEGESEAPASSEEGPQSTETSAEEHITTIQPVATELPTTEETPEEGEAIHPHIDRFPEATVKPETDYSAEGELTLGSDEEHLRPVNHTMETTERPYRPSFHEKPATTLAPHIPEYPDQTVSGEDNPHFPMHGGSYLNPDEDYDEDDQAIYGPGTCRYGGKVYVSAQQIPRDDPCDFCFCFRSDIICLQQSCPPPIPGCHEEPISGFCCPRYECPVSMATALNLTTTTTTTTTTLPPHFLPHAYKGAARRSGCQISGQTYRVGEVIKSESGPCRHCTCEGDGKMKCDPRMCNPEPTLRQMIAAATAKRRR